MGDGEVIRTERRRKRRRCVGRRGRVVAGCSDRACGRLTRSREHVRIVRSCALASARVAEGTREYHGLVPVSN